MINPQGKFGTPNIWVCRMRSSSSSTPFHSVFANALIPNTSLQTLYRQGNGQSRSPSCTTPMLHGCASSPIEPDLDESTCLRFSRYNVVPRADLKRTILDPIYGVGNNDISLASVHSHRISLFFMVLATGIFYDDHPSASIMAEQYSALAYAAYSLDSISQEATTASVQAMFSMCFFVYLTDRSNNEMRWLLSGLAARVALVVRVFTG